MIHPVVRDLFLDLGRHPGFQDLLRRVAKGSNASLSGLTTTAKAVYAVLLWQLSGRPLIIVVDGNKEAEELAEAVGTFFTLLATDAQGTPQLLPALDVLPLQNLSPHAEILEQRPEVLDELRRLEREHGTVLLLCFERIPPREHCHRLTLIALLNEPSKR